jgi:hypothetical protein
MPKRKTAPKPSRSQKIKLLPTPSVDELNKVLGPAREARRAREALGLPTRLRLPSATSGTLKSRLQQAELDQLAAKYRADMRKLVEEQIRTRLTQSKSIQAYLDRRIAARREALEILSGVRPAQRYQFIDRPAWILTTTTGRALQLDSDQRASFSSWAKLRHYSNSDETVELHFYYFWQNSTDMTMVFTVDAPITLNGFASAHASPSRDEERGNSASLILSVELEAFKWVNWASIKEGAGVSSAAWQVVHLGAHGERYDPSVDDPTQGADGVGQNVIGYFNLRIEDLVVHPGETMLFDVFLKMQTWGVWYGSTDVDFSSNAFQVTSPYVVIDRGAGVVDYYVST